MRILRLNPRIKRTKEEFEEMREKISDEVEEKAHKFVNMHKKHLCPRGII